METTGLEITINRMWQLLFSHSHVWLFATPWTAAHQASLSFTVALSLLRLTTTEWCHPTISSSVTPPLPALNLSQHQGLLQWVGSSHHAEYCSFSFSISHSSDYSESGAFWIKSFSLPQHLVSQIHSLACRVESRVNLGSVTRGHLLEFPSSLFWLQTHKWCQKPRKSPVGNIKAICLWMTVYSEASPWIRMGMCLSLSSIQIFANILLQSTQILEMQELPIFIRV